MSLFVLCESAAGYSLFKTEASLLKKSAEEIAAGFSTASIAKSNASLTDFGPFKDVKDALADATSLAESKMGSRLKKFLKTNLVKNHPGSQLAVVDTQLARDIKQKLEIDVVCNPSVLELTRGIKSQLDDLLVGLTKEDSRGMSLSLSHSLNRFKLKFSPDKIDTMVIQAVGFLDDIDKDINNYGMRLKEWYGWHFPELAKIVVDNGAYAKCALKIGMRTNTKNVDLSEIPVPEELESQIKQAAEVSMGSEITEEDLERIHACASTIIEMIHKRSMLADYLRQRMSTIAPNLTHMVGELVGAKLLAQAGSLMDLAKHPSSTVQILGAEKALFRALKTKSPTPKYGLLYHAHLIGQTTPKLKGKMSRVLAAKLALCVRVDALGQDVEPSIGIKCKKYVEDKLQKLTEQETNSQNNLKGQNYNNQYHSAHGPSTMKYTPERMKVTADAAGLAAIHTGYAKKQKLDSS